MEELVWALIYKSFITTKKYVKLDKNSFINEIEKFNELVWAEKVDDYVKSLIESGEIEFQKMSALYKYGEGIVSEEMMSIDWDRMSSLAISIYIDRLDVKIIEIVFNLAEKLDCIVYDNINEKILSKEELVYNFNFNK